MALTFFWRCESTTFSGTDDYSAGDSTPTANGSVSISSTQARVGTNSIYVSDFTDYYGFDSASIFSSSEFAFGFSVYFGSVNSGAILTQVTDASEGDNHIRVSVSGTELSVEVESVFETPVAVTTSGLSLSSGAWYGVVVRGSSTNQDIRLEVYNASDTLIASAENLSTGSAVWNTTTDIDLIQLGDEGAGTPDAYLDNVFFADDYDEPLQNNFTIAAYANYVGAGGGDPEGRLIGGKLIRGGLLRSGVL